MKIDGLAAHHRALAGLSATPRRKSCSARREAVWVTTMLTFAVVFGLVACFTLILPVAMLVIGPTPARLLALPVFLVGATALVGTEVLGTRILDHIADYDNIDWSGR